MSRALADNRSVVLRRCAGGRFGKSQSLKKEYHPRQQGRDNISQRHQSSQYRRQRTWNAADERGGYERRFIGV